MNMNRATNCFMHLLTALLIGLVGICLTCCKSLQVDYKTVLSWDLCQEECYVYKV